MTQYQVEHATEADISVICQLGRVEDGCEVSSQIRFYEETELREWISEPENNILLVVSSSIPVGFLFCKVISHHWATLDNIVVNPEFRGQGAGKALFEALTKILKEKGIIYLSTLIDVNDQELSLLLDRGGFSAQKRYVWFDRFLS